MGNKTPTDKLIIQVFEMSAAVTILHQPQENPPALEWASIRLDDHITFDFEAVRKKIKAKLHRRGFRPSHSDPHKRNLRIF